MNVRAFVETGVRRVVALTALATFVVGVVLRYYYILVAHHPRHHAMSDVRNMLGTAEKLLSGQLGGEPRDTIWPPGTAALLAIFQRIDPTLGVGAWTLFLQSVAIPILIAHTTKLLFGQKSAWFALGLASLHFGFIHYGGFFLSEQVFQFAMALALWQTVAVLTYVRHGSGVLPGAPPAVNRRHVLMLLLMGSSVGLAWMYAASLRPTAMPTGLCVAMVLAFWAWKGNDKSVLLLLAGGVLASGLALIPLADRCTRLDGEERCLISNNIAMNMVLGQAGEVRGVVFHDSDAPERRSAWAPPSLAIHDYQGTRTVDFTIYDEEAALAWLTSRFLDDPGAFLVRSIGNALDLFGVTYWPREYAPASSRLAMVAGQLFLALVIGPSLMAWVVLCRRLRFRQSQSFKGLDPRQARLLRPPGENQRGGNLAVFERSEVVAAAGIGGGGLRLRYRGWRFRTAPALLVCLATPVALVFSAAATMGEARYRTPMDGIFISLAAALYAGSLHVRPHRGLSRTLLRGGMIAGSGIALGLLVLVVLVSHPLTLILKEPSLHRGLSAVSVDVHEEVDASNLSEVREAGSAWDAAGNHVFECDPRCSELIIKFPSVVRRSSVELSVDSNDAYQIAFYREQTRVAHLSLAQTRRKALRVERIQVPKPARNNFDAIGVIPLHGDGRYSVGHVRPR